VVGALDRAPGGAARKNLTLMDRCRGQLMFTASNTLPQLRKGILDSPRIISRTWGCLRASEPA
jgi:hypothetical protein